MIDLHKMKASVSLSFKNDSNLEYSHAHSKAHICIAGITNRKDQQAVALDIPNDGNHLLVFEYVVTNESLLGEQPQSNLICTHLSEIGALLEQRRPNVMNLIRYETREPEYLVNQLRRISEYLGPELDGF
jgi:hypothetical protein